MPPKTAPQAAAKPPSDKVKKLREAYPRLTNEQAELHLQTHGQNLSKTINALLDKTDGGKWKTLSTVKKDKKPKDEAKAAPAKSDRPERPQRREDRPERPSRRFKEPVAQAEPEPAAQEPQVVVVPSANVVKGISFADRIRMKEQEAAKAAAKAAEPAPEATPEKPTKEKRERKKKDTKPEEAPAAASAAPAEEPKPAAEPVKEKRERKPKKDKQVEEAKPAHTPARAAAQPSAEIAATPQASAVPAAPPPTPAVGAAKPKREREPRKAAKRVGMYHSMGEVEFPAHLATKLENSQNASNFTAQIPSVPAPTQVPQPRSTVPVTGNPIAPFPSSTPVAPLGYGHAEEKPVHSQQQQQHHHHHHQDPTSRTQWSADQQRPSSYTTNTGYGQHRPSQFGASSQSSWTMPQQQGQQQQQQGQQFSAGSAPWGKQQATTRSSNPWGAPTPSQHQQQATQRYVPSYPQQDGNNAGGAREQQGLW